MLPPALEEFARQPIWSTLFLLLALAVTLFSGWSLLRSRKRQDLYYLLLGLYLTAAQLLLAFPSFRQMLGISWTIDGLLPRLLVAAPAIALFVLGVKAR